jgi:hypothetical protein
MESNVEQILLSDIERKRKLAEYLRFAAVREWKIESQNEFNATLVSGQKCNHTLHALVTIVGGALTCGFLLLWAIPWIVLAITQKEERLIVFVDEFGEIVSHKV